MSNVFPHSLLPIDLQVIKTCSVIFVFIMLEWVIEERAVGHAAEAEMVCQ